jgi:hypothetical protein
MPTDLNQEIARKCSFDIAGMVQSGREKYILQALTAATEQLRKENEILKRRVSEYQPYADAALTNEKQYGDYFPSTERDTLHTQLTSLQQQNERLVEDNANQRKLLLDCRAQMMRVSDALKDSEWNAIAERLQSITPPTTPAGITDKERR